MSFLSLSLKNIGFCHIYAGPSSSLHEGQCSSWEQSAKWSCARNDRQGFSGTRRKDPQESRELYHYIKTPRKLVRGISLHPKNAAACLQKNIYGSLVLWHIHLIISKRIPKRLLWHPNTGHSSPISLIGSTVPWQYWQQEPGHSACCDPKMPNFCWSEC